MSTSEAQLKRWWSRLRWAAAIALAALAIGLVTARLLYPYPEGPPQPLPFSHRIHAGVRGHQLSSFVTTARTGRRTRGCRRNRSACSVTT